MQTQGRESMPFHRFEDLDSNYLTPHLSTGQAPIIEGRYMYFCRTFKEAGTGSELHYHPNELLIFPLSGKINAVVGNDRRIVSPGTFIHVPAFARHSMKATEDGDLSYLYIKDQTWTVVGIAADEAPPETAMSVEEVNRIHQSGAWAGQEKAPEKSQAIVDGLGDCYYPILASLDAPVASANRVCLIEGERLAFGFFECPPGYMRPRGKTAHEEFMYVLSGGLDIQVADESRNAGPGDVIEIPKDSETGFKVTGETPVRYAAVRSMPYLEMRIDE